MTERPIIFSSASVKAILAGDKTQTRRVCLPNLPRHASLEWFGMEDGRLSAYFAEGDQTIAFHPCPYGNVGDRLWVREPFRYWWDEEGGLCCCVKFEDGFMRKPGFDDLAPDIKDEATGHNFAEKCDKFNQLRPAIHMPRWASRLTLEITDIRVQRVQEISEADAKAEGAKEQIVLPGDRGSFVAGFYFMWDEINHARAPWDENPWVWAISFKRVSPDPVQLEAKAAEETSGR